MIKCNNHIAINLPSEKDNNQYCHSNHQLSEKIGRIENSPVIIEKNKNSIKFIAIRLIKKVKNIFPQRLLSAPTVDRELELILAQGRQLSQTAESVYESINSKNSITEVRPLSLTGPTGIFIGGMLLSATIVGGGLYYWRRSSPQYSTPANTEERDNLGKQINLHHTTHSFAPLSHKQKMLISAIWQPNAASLLDRKDSIDLSSILLSKSYQAILSSIRPRVKKNLSCPEQRGGVINLQIPYIYTSQQPAICLTSQFNQRCQRAHQQSRIGKSCFYVRPIMVLKLSKISCLCPPPTGYKMKIRAPNSRKKNKVSHLKPTTMAPKISSQNLSNISRHIQQPDIQPSIDIHQEIGQQRLSDSKAYLFLSHNNQDKLAKNISEAHYDDITRVNIVACYNERENITLSKILRIISKTIESPITSVLEEGHIVIKHSYYDQSCTNNSAFLDVSKKIEKTLDSMLSWIPRYNKVRFITLLVSSVLDLISDEIEKKELSFDKVSNINDQTINISKDLISSITTKKINQLDKDLIGNEMKKITQPLSFKDNKLIITLPNKGKNIITNHQYNHLYDSETKGYLFFDQDNQWSIDDSMVFNENVKDTIEKAKEIWKNSDDIYFFKNSSPHLYGDGILLRHKGDIYALISNELYRVEENQINEDIFRYIISDEKKTLPIIHKGQKWVFEDSSSLAASNDLRYFLEYNNSIKSRLKSQNLQHRNVGPLTLSQNLQFDDELNQHIKINNDYYRLKQSLDTSHYIEGDYDILPLSLNKMKFTIKKNIYEDICCFYKATLSHIEDSSLLHVQQTENKKNYYLDNTVLDHIDNHDFLYHTSNKLSPTEAKSTLLELSENIKGGYSLNGDDYIYFQHNFIKAYANGDDTYIFGDINDDSINIHAYRNAYSDTYFKLPVKNHERRVNIKSTPHCITKRQPSLLCYRDYFIDHELELLLNINHEYSIIAPDDLQSVDNYHNIFRSQQQSSEMYYESPTGKFFHLRESEINSRLFIPTVFNIHGKKVSQEIDLDHTITGVCIIKDFDSKKIIYTTPREANNYILNMERKNIELTLKWQESTKQQTVNIEEVINTINFNCELINKLDTLDDLFRHAGKKVITTVDISEKRLADTVTALCKSKDMFYFETLRSIEQSSNISAPRKACIIAFNKTLKIIKNAASVLDNNQEKIDMYIKSVLGISNPIIYQKFEKSIRLKISRMNMFFNENNKENIIIIMRKDEKTSPADVLTKEGLKTLGVTLNNDPLDRIYINSAIMPELSIDLAQPSSSANHNANNYNRLMEYYSNKFTDTMLHEAVHALGSPEDYLYLDIDHSGFIERIGKSIKKIENSMTENNVESKYFKYLSRIYFMSNIAYKNYDIDSLYHPAVLSKLFRHDEFFRSIVLLNNPDVISLIIREISNYYSD